MAERFHVCWGWQCIQQISHVWKKILIWWYAKSLQLRRVTASFAARMMDDDRWWCIWWMMWWMLVDGNAGECDFDDSGKAFTRLSSSIPLLYIGWRIMELDFICIKIMNWLCCFTVSLFSLFHCTVVLVSYLPLYQCTELLHHCTEPLYQCTIPLYQGAVPVGRTRGLYHHKPPQPPPTLFTFLVTLSFWGRSGGGLGGV